MIINIKYKRLSQTMAMQPKAILPHKTKILRTSNLVLHSYIYGRIIFCSLQMELINENIWNVRNERVNASKLHLDPSLGRIYWGNQVIISQNMLT